MKLLRRLILGLLAGALVGAGPAQPLEGIPRYAHIIMIVEENKAAMTIIGKRIAPRITALAKAYGTASTMYGEVHPSEGNYVAMIAGNTFGIHDDAVHHFEHPSLPDQLHTVGLDWRGYFGSLPEAGSTVVASPANATEPAALYASKHNPFVNFDGLRTAPDFAKHTVGLERFGADLQADTVPAFAFVVPNQCDEMHGLSATALNVPADCSGPAVITRGDRITGELVDRIMASPLWRASSNTAIVITFDEDDKSTVGDQGCCGYEPNADSNFGGGRIPTVVITNHGPRGVVDPTPYNHYSLLRTLEDAFAIPQYLELAGATDRGVRPMKALFAK